MTHGWDPRALRGASLPCHCPPSPPSRVPPTGLSHVGWGLPGCADGPLVYMPEAGQVLDGGCGEGEDGAQKAPAEEQTSTVS